MKRLTRRNKYGKLYVIVCEDISCRDECTILSKVCHSSLGELSEWLKEHAWKACVRRTLYREFESLTLRHEISAHCLAMRFYILFKVGLQRLGPAQWSLANPVRPGREQR